MCSSDLLANCRRVSSGPQRSRTRSRRPSSAHWWRRARSTAEVESLTRSSILLVAIIALVLAVASAWLGLAFAFNQYAVTQFVASEEGSGSRREALLAQRLAARLAPFEAGFQFQIAAFVDPQLCRQRGTDCDAQLARLRATIQRRPYWPFAWQRYAEACAAIDDLPCSLAALREAWRFGRNERKVREAALAIGLTHWSRLSAEDRAFVVEVVEHVQRYDKKLLQSIADQSGTTDRLRELLKDSAKADALRASISRPADDE